MHLNEIDFFPRLKRYERKLIQTGGPTGSAGDREPGSRARCKGCRLRIRGAGHEDGDHHNQRPIRSPSKTGRR